MIRATYLSLLVAENPSEMAALAAEILEKQCREALLERRVFTLAVSGGKTPADLFRLLASPAWLPRLDWEKTALYWVDEHCVGPEHPESNYRLARAELLSRVPITRFYRMKGEDNPIEAAAAYENLLREHFSLAPGEVPHFDCILLGVGDDGATGSLFPDTGALEENKRLVVDQYLHHLKSSRLTMTLPVLNNARCCVFMANGGGKHHVLSTALNLMAEPVLPAQMVRPRDGKLCWIIDEAAYSGA
ncbi:MAG: 6-phosphogluconolactonase [Deltaproteobacteria bacterium]|jgi:6-phosphogluconolactonase|nr:6-phosphogluconolactonase [Deltaproteobacteria bacterium]